MEEFWAAIATFLAALLVFVQTNKTQKINYLSDEELKWRNDLRSHIKNLYTFQSTPSQDIFQQLNSLKPLLNPLGKSSQRVGTRNVYREDTHIWLTIQEIEKDYYNINAIGRLIDYLQLLLKYDWEESKSKLRYKLFDGFIMCSLLVYIFLFILWIIQPEWVSIYGNTISWCIPATGLIMNVIALLLFYFYTNKNSIFLGIDNFKSAFGVIINLFFLCCYMLPLLGLVYRYNEKMVNILQQTAIISDVDKSRLTGVLIATIYLFEFLFLLLTTNHKSQHVSAIQAVEYRYLCQELADLKELLDENENYKEDQKLEKLYRKVTRYEDLFEKKNKPSTAQELSIKEMLTRIDRNYLWEQSSFKRLIKHLYKIIMPKKRWENKFCVLWTDIKDAFEKFIKT